MALFRSFEDMEVWQQSRLLVQAVRNICKRPLAQKDWSFINQITRAARSVSANIAEGSDALTTTEFINFLGYAKRSAAEVRAHLFDARDEKYIAQKEFQDLAELTKRIQRMLASLMHHLQSRGSTIKRTHQSPITKTPVTH